MRTLALVPARSGSKGIPGKNTRLFRGKPLLAWAIEVGLATCDHVTVSTEDPEIGVLAAQYGASILVRPGSLATDETPMLAVVRHALKYWCGTPDVIVLLQPTQPLRKPEHVREALKLLEETGADSVVSVVDVPAHYSPDYVVSTYQGRLLPYDLGVEGMDRMALRRQDARPAYSRDGTVYAIRRERIEAGSLYGRHSRPLIIPSSESVNLDTEEDWTLAEARMNG